MNFIKEISIIPNSLVFFLEGAGGCSQVHIYIFFFGKKKQEKLISAWHLTN